jgi:hypothetical protein
MCCLLFKIFFQYDVYLIKYRGKLFILQCAMMSVLFIGFISGNLGLCHVYCVSEINWYLQ